MPKNMTVIQALAGGGRLAEAVSRQLAQERSAPRGPAEGPKAQRLRALPKPPKLTQAEIAYRTRLDALKAAGEIADYKVHAFKVSIGEPGKACWYTPDFLVINLDRTSKIIEVKGAYLYEDSRVKFLAAQNIYFWWTWEMWQKKDGQWTHIL